MAVRALNSVVNFFIPATSSDRNGEIHQPYVDNEDARHLGSYIAPPADAQVPRKESGSSRLKSDPVLKGKKSKTLDSERSQFIVHERHSRKRAKDEIQELTNDLEQEKEKRRLLQRDLTDAFQKISAMTKTIKSHEKDREDIIVQYNALRSELLSREQKVSSLEERSWKQQQEIHTLNDKLKGAEEKSNQMVKLLEERTDDLKGVETFITTADLYSGAEIIKMVETLNAEIFQTAAFVSELLEDTSSRATAEQQKKDIEKYKGALRTAASQIGSELLLHLQNKIDEVQADPLPLQLALQGIIAGWCEYRLRYFTSGQAEAELQKLYNKIRMSEIQSVTGRWRSITHAQLRDPQSAPNATLLLDMMLALLCLCGWSPTGAEAHVSNMRTMISGIEKLQVQLKRAIKEDIITAELEVFKASQENFSDVIMENEYSKDMYAGSSNGEKVLLAVGLGLQKTVMRPEMKRDILVKSKVALSFVLGN